MKGLVMAKNTKEEGDENSLTKGAKDDWEALSLILEALPALKSRVLHKIREFKSRGSEEIKVNKRDLKGGGDK